MNKQQKQILIAVLLILSLGVVLAANIYAYLLTNNPIFDHIIHIILWLIIISAIIFHGIFALHVYRRKVKGGSKTILQYISLILVILIWPFMRTNNFIIYPDETLSYPISLVLYIIGVLYIFFAHKNAERLTLKKKIKDKKLKARTHKIYKTINIIAGIIFIAFAFAFVFTGMGKWFFN